MKKRILSLLLAALLCAGLLPTAALSALCEDAPASFSLSPDTFSLTPEDFDEGYASLSITADALVLGMIEWNGTTYKTKRLNVSPASGNLKASDDRTLPFLVYTEEGNGDGNSVELRYSDEGAEKIFQLYIDPTTLAAAQPGEYTGSLTCGISWTPVNAVGDPVSIPLTLTVPEPMYTVTVNGGTGGGDYAEGDSVTITANEPETGKRFLEWKGADGLTFTEGDANTATATFIMPAEAVTLSVKYANIPPASFSLSPDAISLTPEDFSEGYASLAIKADRLVLGMIEWNGEANVTQGLDVSLAAGDLTNSDGRKLHFQLYTEEAYGEGKRVDLSYSNAREEKTFQFYINPTTLAAAKSGVYTGSLTCSISWVPMNAPGDLVSIPLMLTVSAPVYTVTVNGGAGSGDYEEGASVTITANEPESGKQFKEWTGAQGLNFTEGDVHSATATFTMPAEAVTLTSTYEEIPATVYTVTLKAGAGTGDNVIIRSSDEGRMAQNWASAQNGQFWYEGGKGFWFKYPDCPASFTTPSDSYFAGWGPGSAPGTVYLLENTELTLTAKWESVNASYSVSMPASLTLDEPGYTDVPFVINELHFGKVLNDIGKPLGDATQFIIKFNDGELKSNTGESIHFITWINNYFGNVDYSPESIRIYINPDDYASAAPGVYVGNLLYEYRWEYDGMPQQTVGSGSIALIINLSGSDGCTVYLSPGAGSGDLISFSPDVDGIALSKETAQNCQFYPEDGGGLGFRLDAAYCPDTFTAPGGGYIFNGWNGSTGYITVSEGTSVHTANWQQSPVTLSPCSVTLTGAGDNTFTITPAVYNGERRISLGFSNGSLSNGTQTIPFTCSGGISGFRDEQITVSVDPSAFSSAVPGQYTGWLSYSGRLTMQLGTPAVIVSGAIPLLLVVPERPRYAVEITGGDGGGSYAEGESVTIMANEPESGKQFKVWSGAEGLSFTAGDMYSATATFTMPANAVTLTATYENAVSQLDVAKSTAKAELENYKDPADYRPAQQTELESAISAGKNAIDAAADTDAVAAALAAAKTVIDAIKTDAQLTAEETLAAAKTTAKTELAAYKNAADYRSAQQTELTNAIETGNTNIDAAATIAEVNTALANAKAAIDAIKTDAQLTAEEEAAQAAVNQAAADAVAAKIAAIGEVAYTNESKALIDEALAAYNALTAAQKALVENAAVLTAAEARYAELQAAAETPTDPTEPSEPENPDEPSGNDLCKWCEKDHSGSFWQKIVGFFHSVLYFFAHLFGKK